MDNGFYNCDPYKNIECTKENCFINGGPCYSTTEEEFKVENEIRYYLKQMLALIEPADESAFKPSYIITAVKLPTGAIELAVNTTGFKEKIEYILDAYDEDMRLKTNPEVEMQNIMVV